MKTLNLIIFSYAKQALVANSREQQRMETYATTVDSLHLIVPTRKFDKLPTRYQSGNLTIYGTNTHTRIGTALKFYWLGRRIIKQNPNTKYIISSQDPFQTGLPGLMLSLRSRLPHHLQLHGDNYGNPHWYRQSIWNPLKARFGLYVLKRAFKIRVVSERIKNSLVALGIAARKIVVLPIAVELESFLAVGRQRKLESSTYHRFIFIGRLAPEKNLSTLIRAFAEVLKLYPTATLELVGKGEEEERLKTLVKELGITKAVTFTAWTDDVPGLLKEADVFILPSTHEGYALVLIEAMAAGLPIISTDVGCVGECVRHDREGLVTEPTVFDLSEAMKQYLQSPHLVVAHASAALSTAESIAADQQAYTKQWKDSYVFD